jgi:hypothetical protein
VSKQSNSEIFELETLEAKCNLSIISTRNLAATPAFSGAQVKGVNLKAQAVSLHPKLYCAIL